jgi:hypothetical protein
MPSSKKRLQRWRRFTILDMLVLTFAYALGFGLARSWACLDGLSPAAGWSETTVLVGIYGTAAGTALALPTVLAVQRWGRGRREPLSTGEQAGCVPLAVGCCIALCKTIEDGRLDLNLLTLIIFVPMWIAILVYVRLAAEALWQGVRGRRNIPCFWTDQFGSLAHLVALSIPLLVLVLA